MKQAVARESRVSPGGWFRAARRRLEARNDAGISMVELMVAVVVIAIVLLSGTTAIDFALSTTNAQRLKVEATNLAVTSMERDEQLAASLGIGATTATRTINTTTFTVVTAVTDFDQNGSQLTTVCTSSGSSVAQQIWQVTVTVSWPHMNGIQPITQSTEVAPGQSNALDLTDGEIAVPVNGTNGTYLTTPLNFTVTPIYIGAGTAPAYPTPTGQADPAGTVFNTGSYGCGVVTGLATSPSWDYVVTLVDNPGWVSSAELSDANLIGGNPDDPTETLAAVAGKVSLVNPPFQMGEGVTTTVTLQPVSYSCPGGTPAPSCYLTAAQAGYAAPLATLPVTFGNSSLPNNQYTFGGGTTGITSELLYPYSAYDVWSGDMAQSSPGAEITGTGSLIYTGPGTTDDTPTPVVLSMTGGTTAAVSVPTYDLSISVSSGCAGVSLFATEQSGSDLSYALNPLSGTTSTSGMPLGQYLLSSSSSSCPLSSTNGLYIWITPTGVYQSTAAMATPYASPATLVSGSVAVSE